MAVKITLPPGKQQQQPQASPAPQSRLLPSRRSFRVTPTTTRLEEIDKPATQRPVSLQEMGVLLLHEKKTFGAALAGIGIASACQMCVPYIFGSVVDLLSASVGVGASTGAAAGALVSNSVVMEGLRDNAMAMLGVGLAGTAATYVSTAQLDIVGQRISMDLRKRLFSNIVRGGGREGGREGGKGRK
jgi:ABC-type multidrug transport system fused ATPase/permease subunit